MAIYSIKDLEKLSGIQAHTIRIWEKRYQLVRPKRTDTNIRVYTDDDLKRLLNVAILNNNGIKISKIAKLSDDEVRNKILGFTGDISKAENQIDVLIMSMIELNEQKFEKILSRLVLQIGFEDTITKIIYPFLNKVGILWQTGSINPAQEHFITNLIRQKLFVAIDSIISEDVSGKKRFILFLPEGELHDIGLLYYAYLIKKCGHHVIYLGQSVPFPDLVEVNKLQPSQYMLTSITTSIVPDEFNAYLHALSEAFANLQIFILSGHLGDIKLNKFPNIVPISNPEDFRSLLKSLGGN